MAYNNYFLWRGTCTDPTWKDPACLHICTTGTGKENLRNEHPPQKSHIQHLIIISHKSQSRFNWNGLR